MQIDLVAPYPYETLSPSLKDMIRGARRVDAAIAFVTKAGADLLRAYLDSQPSGDGFQSVDDCGPADWSGNCEAVGIRDCGPCDRRWQLDSLPPDRAPGTLRRVRSFGLPHVRGETVRFRGESPCVPSKVGRDRGVSSRSYRVN